MKNPTIEKIVESYLREHGFDGLFDEDCECACEVDDLSPCGNMNGACQAGYKGPGNDEFDFCIMREKPGKEKLDPMCKFDCSCGANFEAEASKTFTGSSIVCPECGKPWTVTR